jgi:hypothetical protein
VTQSIIHRDPILISTEFFSWEDERPSVRPVNFSGYPMNAIRIIALGYRFHTAEPKAFYITEGPNKGKVIANRSQAGNFPTITEIEALEQGLLPYTPIQCAGHA